MRSHSKPPAAPSCNSTVSALYRFMQREVGFPDQYPLECLMTSTLADAQADAQHGNWDRNRQVRSAGLSLFWEEQKRRKRFLARE